MGKLLKNFDDFQVGMLITVHTGKQQEIVKETLAGSILTKTQEAMSWAKGTIYKITAIDMPYMVVEHVKIKAEYPDSNHICETFDMRNAIYMEVSQELLDAVMKDVKRQL